MDIGKIRLTIDRQARLVLIGLLLVSGFSLLAKVPSIDEVFVNTPLKEVLTVLKKKYRIKIAYSDQLVADKRVNAELRNVPVKAAFDKLLEDTGITYEYLSDEAVILKPKKAEPYKIIGEIFDANTQEGLPFALISSGKSSGTTSNEDGYFTISSTDTALQISYVGYRDTVIYVEDLKNQRLKIGLNPTINTLSEVVVAGQSDNFLSPDGIGEVDLNPKLVTRMPQTAEKDVFRLLQMMPGVTSTNELSSGLAINGGTADQNLVLFDGFAVYHQDHMFGYFSAINPYAVKSVRMLKTGYPASYGGRSSGIIQFTGNDGSASNLSGRIGVNLLSANVSLETPIGTNSTAFFSGRRSYTDYLSTGLFNSIFNIYEQEITDQEAIIEEQEYNPDFYYDDFNLKFSTRLNPRDQVSLSLYTSTDNLNYQERLRIEYPEDTSVVENNTGEIRWGNLGSSARWARLWNSGDYSEAFISYSRYASDFFENSNQEWSIGDDLLEVLDRNRVQENLIEDVGIKIRHEIDREKNNYQIGMESSIFQTNISNQLNDALLTSKEQEGLSISTLYYQGFHQVTGSTRLGAGVRLNYASGRSQVYSEPRLSLDQQINDRVSTRVSAGIYNQFINQIQTQNILQGSRDLWVLSDNQVPVQQSFHYSWNTTYEGNNGLGFQANVYHRRTGGILDYAFRRGDEITEFVNYENQFFEGEGRATGMELLAKKEAPRWVSWVSYTLGRVEYKFEEINLGRWYDADHDQRHELNFYLSYQFKNFNFYATWFYGSGRPYSEFAEREEEDDRNEDVVIVSTPQRNGSRLPDYHRLDLGLSSTWKVGLNRIKVDFQLFNTYDRENVGSVNLRPLPRQRRNGRPPESMSMNPPPPGNPPPPTGNPPPDGPPDGGPPRGDDGDGRGMRNLGTFENRLMGITPSFSVEFEF